MIIDLSLIVNSNYSPKIFVWFFVFQTIKIHYHLHYLNYLKDNWNWLQTFCLLKKHCMPIIAPTCQQSFKRNQSHQTLKRYQKISKKVITSTLKDIYVNFKDSFKTLKEIQNGNDTVHLIILIIFQYYPDTFRILFGYSLDSVWHFEKFQTFTNC